MSNNLKQLLDDLSNDVNLQSEYISNPEMVMDRYNLNKKEKELLLNEDTDGIKALLNLNTTPKNINKIVKLL